MRWRWPSKRGWQWERKPLSISHHITSEEEFSWDGTTGFGVSGVIVAKTVDGFRWSRRSSDYPSVVLENDPLDIAQAGVSYNVWVKQGGVTKVTQYGVTGNQLDIDGTMFAPGQIEILIEAVSSAGNSLVTRSSKFTITP